MYLAMGIASGLLCHFSGIIDIDLDFFSTNLTPAIILGIMISLAGRYIGGVTPRNPWLSPFILILACSIGWFLALQSGAKYWAEDWSWIASGIIGGFFVGIGLVIAWKLKRASTALMLTALAGGLGGLVYMLFHVALNFSDIEELLLLVEWQGILLLGIGITIHLDERQSMVDK
jgi:peptidoglycan/LPS O-acetylase OafA/YrhL